MNINSNTQKINRNGQLIKISLNIRNSNKNKIPFWLLLKLAKVKKSLTIARVSKDILVEGPNGTIILESS